MFRTHLLEGGLVAIYEVVVGRKESEDSELGNVHHSNRPNLTIQAQKRRRHHKFGVFTTNPARTRDGAHGHLARSELRKTDLPSFKNKTSTKFYNQKTQNDVHNVEVGCQKKTIP